MYLKKLNRPEVQIKQLENQSHNLLLIAHYGAECFQWEIQKLTKHTVAKHIGITIFNGSPDSFDWCF